MNCILFTNVGEFDRIFFAKQHNRTHFIATLYGITPLLYPRTQLKLPQKQPPQQGWKSNLRGGGFCFRFVKAVFCAIVVITTIRNKTAFTNSRADHAHRLTTPAVGGRAVRPCLLSNISARYRLRKTKPAAWAYIHAVKRVKSFRPPYT